MSANIFHIRDKTFLITTAMRYSIISYWFWQFEGPCHGPGCSSPAWVLSHVTSYRILWWTQWQWDRFLPTNLQIFCHCHSTYDPYTIIHPRRCIILADHNSILQLNTSPHVWRDFRFHQEISTSDFMNKLILGTALPGVCAFSVLGCIPAAKAAGTWSL